VKSIPIAEQNLVLEVWADWENGGEPGLKLRRGARRLDVLLAEIAPLVAALTAEAAELAAGESPESEA